MTKYEIKYNSNYKIKNFREINFIINKVEFKILFIPINHKSNSEPMIKEYNLDYLNNEQIKQLNNLLYKLPDSCFYEEIKSYDSLFINSNTVSTKYSVKTTGNLFILNNEKPIGYLSYQLKNNYILLENICISKEFRGKGIFKRVFTWFLKEVENIYFYQNKIYPDLNIIGFKLSVWKESPFNKNNKIVELYNKFGFVYSSTEKYSEKRTYIHMYKNI